MEFLPFARLREMPHYVQRMVNRNGAMIRIVASLNLPVNSNGLMAPWSGKSFIIGSKFFEERSIHHHLAHMNSHTVHPLVFRRRAAPSVH